MEWELTQALMAEHRQRTRHDPWESTEAQRLRNISCDVCMYLSTLAEKWREAQRQAEDDAAAAKAIVDEIR